ncbi:MAG: molybdopterin cofactor-binding domain-containing protein [Cyanobacteria bacterium J06627_8]
MNAFSKSITLYVNGVKRSPTCLPGASLLSTLRDDGWKGVHRVCESGDCGSCTVWVEGEAVHSCIYSALQAEGKAITTIEGLASPDQLSPMQQGFLEKQGFQCGYCTPGMIMTASQLSASTEAAVRRALDGNLCRCTGYQAIVESILAGQEQSHESLPSSKQSGVADVEDEVEHHSTSAQSAPIRSADLLSSPQVGQSIPKQDGPDIVTGKPIYTADWAPSELLHLKVVRSPHAHARIRAIHTDKAEAMPGVHAVLTYRDVPRRPYSTAGHGAPVPDPHDHYLLDNKVRFVGDRVAAVVAETSVLADQACALIEVDYDILPHVLDPDIAMGDRASESCSWSDPLFPPLSAPSTPPILHDEPESFQIDDPTHNIAGEVRLERGNIEAGMAQADHVFERTYQLPAVQHFHLEPHVSITWLDDEGTLVVRSSTQVPFHCQRLLSELFDRPKDTIHVFKAKMGGGFGNKQEILTEDLCALATLKTGRPVQWELTRTEEFTATNSRHATRVHLRIGVTSTGELTAMDMRAIANTGAYGNHGTQVVFLTGSMPLGLYRCANQRFLGRSVYTNTMPAGAFRGYGATQGVFAAECLMDEIAEALSLNPVDFKRKHLIVQQDEVLLGADHHFHLLGSGSLDQTLNAVIHKLGYRPGQAPICDGSIRRGVGVAIAMQGSGLAKIHLARVRLTLKADGRYEMRTGSVDVGTGSDTSLRQIAADELNTTIDQIDIISADTKETPFDAGSYASATLFISGEATRRSAIALKEMLINYAAKHLNRPANQWSLQGDRLNTSTGETLTVQALGQQAQDENYLLSVEQEYAADRSSLTFAAVGVEVEVDVETGRVDVVRCVQALDIGKAINPRICEGQAVGGAVMGIGYALREELKWHASGHILNPHPRTYRLPLAKDIPTMDVILIEESDPYGPCGAKGIGEIGTNCAAPAIANAIANATGVRLRKLPMTPERVWTALQEQSSHTI